MRNGSSESGSYFVCSEYQANRIMPKGQEYSADIKNIYFQIIDFIEKERDGSMTPWNLSTARLLAVLGISERSLLNLKAE